MTDTQPDEARCPCCSEPIDAHEFLMAMGAAVDRLVKEAVEKDREAPEPLQAAKDRVTEAAETWWDEGSTSIASTGAKLRDSVIALQKLRDKNE